MPGEFRALAVWPLTRGVGSAGMASNPNCRYVISLAIRIGSLTGWEFPVETMALRPVRDGGDQMTVHVLVVAGDTAAAESRVRELRRRGYRAGCAGTGTEAMAVHRQADLVLLDLELPDVDGLEICRAIRAAGPTPIIAVTAQDAELDRVLALQAGADDCVPVSCGEREMLARIAALLRRAYPPTRQANSFAIGPLVIDGRRHEVHLDGKPVGLTTKEFELLLALATTPDTVLTRKELMSRVWDTEWATSSRTLDTHVRALRAKLGANSWVITVRGVGYRLGRGPAVRAGRAAAMAPTMEIA